VTLLFHVAKRIIPENFSLRHIYGVSHLVSRTKWALREIGQPSANFFFVTAEARSELRFYGFNLVLLFLMSARIESRTGEVMYSLFNSAWSLVA
jgi:hypothetical protein